MEKIAVYAGSFDPFTNGHLSIVKNAAEVFDQVIVVIAANSEKKRMCNPQLMALAITRCLEREGMRNCLVAVTDELIADLCKSFEAKYLVRGLRNTSDYMYEENIAKINNEINPELKTVYFRADNDVISSSMVRELKKYGKDIDRYVPPEVSNEMR
jgi:pantetheine-phosphate adenylyltransferase